MIALLLLLALLGGAMAAVSWALNAQLSKAVGSPLLAGLISFAIGTAGLMSVSLVAGEPWPSMASFGRVDWWAWAGGFLGAWYLTANILLIPRLGALTTVGISITGQMLSSLVIDQFGLLGVPVQALAAGSIMGALLAIFGAWLISDAGNEVARLSAGRAGLYGFALLTGAALPAQAAINARLREEISAPLLSGGISFAVGTAVLAVVLAVSLVSARRSLPRLEQMGRVPWWAWLGGLAAAVYVDATLVLVSVLGAAVVIGLSVAGQQLASGAVDHFGLLGLPRRPVKRVRLLGIALLLAGIALIQVF